MKTFVILFFLLVLCCCQERKVYVFGSNERGQLGIRDFRKPNQINPVEGKTVKLICGSNNHVIIVTSMFSIYKINF